MSGCEAMSVICDCLIVLFVKVESEQSAALPEQPDEVLKVWDVESSHKYENNQHTSQVKIIPAD